MKFDNKAEAFNYWKNATVEEIEKRAATIKGIIKKDPNADIDTYTIELEALKDAKDNIMENEKKVEEVEEVKKDMVERSSAFTKLNTETRSKEIKNGDIYASPEYRSGFFKKLAGVTLNAAEAEAMNKAAALEMRTSTYSTTTNSAAVIPTETLNEVIQKATKLGGLYGAVRKFNMPSNIAIPVATPSDVAAWHTQGAEVETENPTVTPVNFAAYELMKIFSISISVKKMSISAFESYLTTELARCIMGAIDNAIVNGTGSSQATGILSGVTWNTSGEDQNAFEYAATGLKYSDLLSAAAALKRGYRGKWAMNKKMLYTSIYGLVDGVGNPIFAADPKNADVWRILGDEIILDDYIPDDTIIYGDFDYFGVNMPAGIAVESSTESSFKSGLIDYRGFAICDAKPLVGEAFVKLTKAAAGE